MSLLERLLFIAGVSLLWWLIWAINTPPTHPPDPAIEAMFRDITDDHHHP